MKKKLLLLFVLVFISCLGCTNQYTLTYEDDIFSEQLVITDITQEDDKALLRYSEGSDYLKIDENNSYKYIEKSGSKVYSYKMGEDFVKSPLITTCFENVFVVDKDDYLHIKTDGEYYCVNHDIEVLFKTDKEVIYNNASVVKDNVYKWDTLEDGIEFQVSKVNLANNSSINNNASQLYIRLIICIAFIIVIVFTVMHLKKKNNNS